MIMNRLAALKRLASDGDYRKILLEKKRLKRTPRYIEGVTGLLGNPVRFVDSMSFLYMYGEIFEQEIYRFRPEREDPRILDCGANIGLSAIYFKRLFPKSRITAFEPDAKVFAVLKENLLALGYGDVECVEKALWKEDCKLPFCHEGADAGRVAQDGDKKNGFIDAVRLKPYLSEKIDFLKLDIEGAETAVLEDCADFLKNVKNLFVEYHSFENAPQTLGKILNIFSAAGFRVQIHTALFCRQPFLKKEVVLGMDMQLNVFGYRQADEKIR